MPIRPENKNRYPANWSEIRTQILERAGHRCEWPDCGVGNHWWMQWQGGERVCVGYDERRALYWPGNLVRRAIDGAKMTKVVLTIAHLDHIPENCSPSNLRAWCQLHHLAYDADHHKQTAYATRRSGLAAADLFAGET